MNISGVTIPPEAFTCVLSMLGLKDLARAGLVCKEWKSISEIDILWKKRYEEYCKLYSYERLFNGSSWKSSLRGAVNRKRGAAEVSFKKLNRRITWHRFTIAGNSLIEAFRSSHARSFVYRKNPSKLEPLEIQNQGFAYLVEACLSGNSWVILDALGKVGRFSLETGNLQDFYQIKDFQYVHVNESIKKHFIYRERHSHVAKPLKVLHDDIIVNVHSRHSLILFNKNSKNLKEFPYYEGEEGYLIDFASTANYIFYAGNQKSQPFSHCCVHITRKEPIKNVVSSFSFTDSVCEVVCMAASKQFLAVAFYQGDIKVYRDEEDKISAYLMIDFVEDYAKNPLKPLKNDWNDLNIQIDKELLYIMAGKDLYIWDLTSKTRIAKMTHPDFHREFCVGQNVLTTYAKKRLTTFNFESTQAQLLSITRE